jgi:tetratricopeptide (TPR) repeat protein
VDKSLLTVTHRVPDTRFGMLETLRHFAAELLAQDAEAPGIARRHATRFGELAASWTAIVNQLGARQALGSFTASLGNFRSALAYTQREAPVLLARRAGALGRYWYYAGHWQEALQWYEHALAVGDAVPSDDRAVVLDEQARLEMFLGDESAATRDHRAAVGLAAAAPVALRARTLEGLGEVLLKVGKLGEAVEALELALKFARVATNTALTAEVLTTLATARVAEGRHDEAAQLLDEALALAGERADVFLRVRIHYYRAGLALLRSAVDDAAAECALGAAAADESGDTAWTCHLEEMQGRTLAERGQAGEARLTVTQTLSAFHAAGARSCLPHSLEAAARNRLADGGTDKQRAHQAALLLGAADALCHSLAIVMLPVERALFMQTTARARHALGEDAYAESSRAGAVLTVSEAVQLALAP